MSPRPSLLALLALAFCALAQAALPLPERVSFASLDRASDGRPVAISALYFRPPQAGADARVPLVIAAHGCGGMFSTNDRRREELSQRFAKWTEMLLADGYAVLWPDSFNSRGVRSVCLVKRGEASITPATRRLDMLGARAFASTRPGVDRGRIALAGWSHGGSTVLAAVNGRDPAVATFDSAPEAMPLRAAVAFYPGCGASLRRGADWQASSPIAIHIGELDDWSSPTACVRLVAAARERGAAMTVTIYPGAYHGFDSPSGKVKLWPEVTTGAHPGRGVTIGPDPAARAAATAAVRGFLREKLQ